MKQLGLSHSSEILKIYFRLVTIPQSQRAFYLNKIHNDPSFKAVFGQPLTMTEYINQISPRDQRSKICKDVFMTIPIVAYAKKDFYLLDAINEKIEALSAAGLIDFWHYQNIQKELLNAKVQHYPEVLTLEQMIGCFQILFIGWTLGIVSILLELGSSWLRKSY